MVERRAHKLVGWSEPLCQPLTQRLMMGGVPFFTLMVLLFVGMQMLNFKLYFLLPLLPLLYFVLRLFYRHDPWALSDWLEHSRAVIQRRTRFDV